MKPTLPLLPNPDDADLSEWVGPFDAQQMHEFALAAIAADRAALLPEVLRLADEMARKSWASASAFDRRMQDESRKYEEDAKTARAALAALMEAPKC